MESDIFEKAKKAEFVPYAQTFLGVEFTNLRAPKCLCPFHADEHPSFSVWVKKNRGKCFSCGEGGSIIDFTMAVCGMDATSAAKKICEDLGL